MDDGFFLYCEDTDLCRRLADHGTTCATSPPRSPATPAAPRGRARELYGVLAASRIRYARKHRGRVAAALERAGIVLGALTHCVLSPDRAGYRVALRAALRGEAPPMVEVARPRGTGRTAVARRASDDLAWAVDERPARLLRSDHSGARRGHLAAPAGREPCRADRASQSLGDRRQRLHGRDARDCEELAERYPWIEVLTTPATTGRCVEARSSAPSTPGSSRCRSRRTSSPTSNADVSFEPDFFARLLGAFAGDPRLGIASGRCYEEQDGEWRQRHVTGTTVWGAARAYRRACLADVLPLEERMALGRHRRDEGERGRLAHDALTDLPFKHHREEGERDGSRRRARIAQGRAAHYIGYRPSYLVLRSLHHARREPAALAMIWGYAARPSAASRSSPTRRCATSCAAGRACAASPCGRARRSAAADLSSRREPPQRVIARGGRPP